MSIMSKRLLTLPVRVLAVLALVMVALTNVVPPGGVSSVPTAQAAGNVPWEHKGFSMASYSDGDLSHSGAALQQLASTGANSVTFVVTWYTPHQYSTDIYRTGATASDSSLIWAMQKAQSLGLKVILKPHLDSQDGAWRAFINPSDADLWFRNYTTLINHYADLGRQYGAVALCIGAELVSMSTNVAYESRWRTLIAGARGRFAGKLLYSANWGSEGFAEEFPDVPFWDALDYLGISAYFELATTNSPTVEQLKASWESWKTRKIYPFQQQWNKPLFFIEGGYRSLDGAAIQPWNYEAQGSLDTQEQVDLYEALFQSWSGVPWFAGSAFWFWSPNANISATSTGYEVQNKPAYWMVSAWFGGPPPSGATTWYFAEGYTGPGFDEYLTIQNPNGTDAQVTITYYLAIGGPVVRTLTAPAQARTTVAVHDSSLGVGRDQAVSARVESTNEVGIIAERPMYFTYGPGITGGHNVLGTTAPRRAWYFAEGYTGAGFDEYLTIQNPNPTAGTATITYYLQAGTGPIVRTVPLPASSRTTVQVHSAPSASNPGGLGRTAPGVGHSTKIETDVDTVVERPMYFAYAGGVTGGHNVLGAAAPRTDWLFAEGYTGAGFDEYLTIMNPNPSNAHVRLTYYLSQGGPVVKEVTVPANARTTIAVHDSGLGVGRGQAVSARVESTNEVSIVVERPMYFTYGNGITGGHNVMGATGPRPVWYFAEGYTGTGFDEYLTIMNPSEQDAQVSITYYQGQGGPIIKLLVAPVQARTTVAVHDDRLGVGRGQAVSAKVESTNGVGLVVERPMYFRYLGMGIIDGGHNVLGYAP